MTPLLVRVFVAWFFLAAAAFAQTTDPSTFSDLSTEYDGGVANPTDGSTGNVLQQTLFAAYFWGVAHGGARATVVVSSDYPIYGSRILVPGNVDLVCSSYSPETYTGGCVLHQTDAGDNTATGGSPLLMVDYRYGVLPDHKTICSVDDTPQQPGCTIIDGGGASITGFTLWGGGAAAGGADIGISVLANGVHVQDTGSGFFGGPGIEAGGLNDSIDWNFGTNVNTWWCAHPSQLTQPLGGMQLGIIDGEASHNQYSTGCSFTKSFTVSLEYPYLAAMVVGGAGNLIQDNLLQVDGIGLIVLGMEHRIVDNRVEYQAREAIRNLSHTTLFSGNRITSACLDPNLINLRPGALDNGVPRYPNSPAFLHNGYMIMDPSGNIEQLISGAGTSGATAPDWSVEPGGTTLDGDDLTWENMGPWLTDNSPLSYWAQPSLVTGVCYGVYDNGGGGNTWSANEVGQEVGVNGWSYLRGSYFITGVPSSITGNMCDGDLPDAYGNGQCWWGGDLFVNGGPGYLAPNGQSVNASGGGTAWVGDYSVVVLADNVSRHYNNFQGMAEGQTFSVTSSTVANVIDQWSVDSQGGGWYGHISVGTCTGGPLVVTPGSYYQFHYALSEPGFRVKQMNCPSGSATGASSGLASISPGTLTFATQIDGTSSGGQTVTVSNSTGVPLNLGFAVSGDFAQTNNCGGTIAIGATCAISVTFTPTTAGARTGVLTISDNVSGSSQTVALNGLGTVPSNAAAGIALSSSKSSLTLSSGGQAATATLSLLPENGFVGTVNLKCQVTSQDPSTQLPSPTCSLSPAQIVINNNTSAVSTLVISAQTSAVTGAKGQVFPYKSMSLAALGLLGLLPFRGLRRKSYPLYLGIILTIGMIGCGYTPTPPSTSYKVLITATSGTQPATSISISLDVQ